MRPLLIFMNMEIQLLMVGFPTSIAQSNPLMTLIGWKEEICL